MATCSFDNTAKVWLPSNTNWMLIRNYTGHTYYVNDIEYINNDMIATGAWDGTIKIWSISTGITKRNISTGNHVKCLQLLSNGFHLAAGMDTSTIIVYDINTGSDVASLTGHGTYVNDLELISKDLLASAGDDQTVRIWDLTTHSVKLNLTGHTLVVFGLKLISSDVLASASKDTNIKLWNITMGSLIKTLTGHTSPIYNSIDLLSDGQTLVSASLNKTIEWNISTGECLASFSQSLLIYSLAVINSSRKIGINRLVFLFSIMFLSRRLARQVSKSSQVKVMTLTFFFEI